jgi:hypothetical protein
MTLQVHTLRNKFKKFCSSRGSMRKLKTMSTKFLPASMYKTRLVDPLGELLRELLHPNQIRRSLL